MQTFCNFTFHQSSLGYKLLLLPIGTLINILMISNVISPQTLETLHLVLFCLKRDNKFKAKPLVSLVGYETRELATQREHKTCLSTLHMTISHPYSFGDGTKTLSDKTNTSNGGKKLHQFKLFAICCPGPDLSFPPLFHKYKWKN